MRSIVHHGEANLTRLLALVVVIMSGGSLRRTRNIWR